MNRNNNRLNGWLMGRSQQNRLESGQSIVLIAFLMIGLIAIMGLSIDGGGLLLLRRDTQNAVDAAIVAAAYARCTDGDVIHAATEAAARNGYVDGVDGDTVAVNSPPLSGAKAGDSDYVEVIITAEKEKYFIQIVYEGPLEVTTRAVGYCYDPWSIFREKAIFAGSDECGFSVNNSGSGITITGGIHSNDDIALTGSDINVKGEVTAAGGINASGSKTTFDPSANNPTSGVDPITDIPLIFDISDFAPGGSIASSIPAADYHTFSGNTTFKDEELEGLYYVTGDVKLNQTTVGLNGVTIVATGDIELVNNVKEQDFISYLSNHLLFFTTATATNCGSSTGIKVSGTENVFDGLIYAPFADITLSGSSHTICGALIANTVSTSASDTVINFCDYLPPDPPVIVMAE